MIKTDFLPITLKLSSGKFWPYRKPNNQPLYIYAASNHPPIIKKHHITHDSQKSIEIYCNEEEFKKAIPLYNEALENSGYASSLTFQQEQPKSKSWARKRNVEWFNPPYSDSIKTKHWQGIFWILSKHFPSYHMLHKICNKNCVKLSYRCNAQRCSHHLLAQQSAPQGKTIQSHPLACNCRDKSNCSLNGRCREKSLVYKTTIQWLNNRNVWCAMDCAKPSSIPLL